MEFVASSTNIQHIIRILYVQMQQISTFMQIAPLETVNKNQTARNRPFCVNVKQNKELTNLLSAHEGVGTEISNSTVSVTIIEK